VPGSSSEPEPAPLAALPPQPTAPRAPWYQDFAADGEFLVTSLRPITEDERQHQADAVAAALVDLPGSVSHQAALRTAVGEELASVLGTDTPEQWSELLRSGHAFVADTDLVWLRFKLDARTPADPMQGSDAVDRYGVSFGSTAVSRATAQETTHISDAVLNTALAVGSAALRTATPVAPSLSVANAVKHTHGEGQGVVSGRKLFVTKKNDFDAGLRISVHINGRALAVTHTLPPRLRVALPAALSTPEEPRPDFAASPTSPISVEAVHLTRAHVVLNAIDVDPIVDLAVKELIRMGMPIPSLAKLLPDIVHNYLSETAIRNASRHATTSGHLSEVFRDEKGGGSVSFNLLLAGKEAGLVGVTPGVTTRDDMGTIVDAKSGRLASSKVRLDLNVDFGGLTIPGNPNTGFLTAGGYGFTGHQSSLSVAEKRAGHTVLNQTADQARYRLVAEARLTINLTTGGIRTQDKVSRVSADTNAELGMPRIHAPGFERLAFGALKHPSLLSTSDPTFALALGVAGSAGSSVHPPAAIQTTASLTHGPGPSVSLHQPPQAHPNGPEYTNIHPLLRPDGFVQSQRPDRLDAPRTYPNHELLPAYLSHGILGEGFSKAVRLPGSERVLAELRGQVEKFLKDDGIDPAMLSWREYDTQATAHYGRPALEGDLGAALSGVDQRLTAGGRVFDVSAKLHTIDRLEADLEPPSYELTVNGRALSGVGVSASRATSRGFGGGASGGARIKAPAARVELGRFELLGERNRRAVIGFENSAQKYSRTETSNNVFEHAFDVVWEVKLHGLGRDISWWIDDHGKVTAIVVVPEEHTPRHALEYIPTDVTPPPVYAGPHYGRVTSADDWPREQHIPFERFPGSVHPAFLHSDEVLNQAVEVYRKVNRLAANAMDEWWKRPLRLRRAATSTAMATEFDAVMKDHGWVIELEDFGGYKQAIVIRGRAYGPRYVNRPGAEIEQYLQGATRLEQGSGSGGSVRADGAVGALGTLGSEDHQASDTGPATDQAVTGPRLAAQVQASWSREWSHDAADVRGKIDISRATYRETHTIEAQKLYLRITALRWKGSHQDEETVLLSMDNGLQAIVVHRFMDDLGLVVPPHILDRMANDEMITRALPKRGDLRTLPSGQRIPIRRYTDPTLGLVSGHPEKLDSPVFDHVVNVLRDRGLLPKADGGITPRPNQRHRALTALLEDEGLGGNIVSMFSGGHHFLLTFSGAFGVRFLAGRVRAFALEATDHMHRPDATLTLRSESVAQHSETDTIAGGWKLAVEATARGQAGPIQLNGSASGGGGRDFSDTTGKVDTVTRIARVNPKDTSEEFTHPVDYEVDLVVTSYAPEPLHQIARLIKRGVLGTAAGLALMFDIGDAVARFWDAHELGSWYYNSRDAGVDLRGSLRNLVPTHLTSDQPDAAVDPAVSLVDHALTSGINPHWLDATPPGPGELEKSLAAHISPKTAYISEAIANWAPLTTLPRSRRPRDLNAPGASDVAGLGLGSKHGMRVRFAAQAGAVRSNTAKLLEGEFVVPLPHGQQVKAGVTILAAHNAVETAVAKFKDRSYSQELTQPVEQHERSGGGGFELAFGPSGYDSAGTLVAGRPGYGVDHQRSDETEAESGEVQENNAVATRFMRYYAFDAHLTLTGPHGVLGVTVPTAMHGLLPHEIAEDLETRFADVFGIAQDTVPWIGDPVDSAVRDATRDALEHLAADDRYQPVAMHTTNGLPSHDGNPLTPEETARQLAQLNLAGRWDGVKPLLFVACGSADGALAGHVTDTLRRLWAAGLPDATAFVADNRTWIVPTFAHSPEGNGGPPTPVGGGHGHILVAGGVGFDTAGRPVFTGDGHWQEITKNGSGEPVARELGPYLAPPGTTSTAPEHYDPTTAPIAHPMPQAVSFGRKDKNAAGPSRLADEVVAAAGPSLADEVVTVLTPSAATPAPFKIDDADWERMNNAIRTQSAIIVDDPGEKDPKTEKDVRYAAIPTDGGFQLKNKGGSRAGTVVTYQQARTLLKLAGIARGKMPMPIGRQFDPSEGRPADKLQLRADNQVMNFDTSSLSFAHYSFDLVGGKTPTAPNQRQNDHLTIENSLSSLIAHLADNPGVAEAFLESRLHRKKPQFNEDLKELGNAEIDNFNFRPAQSVQGRRPLGDGLDPQQTLRKERVNRKPADQSAPQEEVEQRISLPVFTGFVETALRRLELHQPLRQAIADSIDRVRQKLGFQADQLYLNRNLGQQLSFTRFATLVAKATFVPDIPLHLLDLLSRDQKIRLTDSSDDRKIIERMKNGDEQIAVLKAIEDAREWSSTQEGSVLNAVRTALVAHYWDYVVDMVLNV
jgi:hypothetical protein